MVLAISAGALRQLSLKYDGHADHPLLPPSRSVSTSQGNESQGNRFSGVMMVVAHRTGRSTCAGAGRAPRCGGRQGDPPPHGPELVSRVVGLFPARTAERLFNWLAEKDGQNKVLNIPISNVPGPREPGRVGGALVTEIYSVGPLTTGSGLNITYGATSTSSTSRCSPMVPRCWIRTS